MSEEPGKYKENERLEFKCAHCNKDLDSKMWYTLTVSTYRDGTDDHFAVLLCNLCLNKIFTKVFRISEKQKKKVKHAPTKS